MGRPNARARKYVTELAAGEMDSTGECLGDDRIALAEDCRIHLDVAVHVSVGDLHARRGERENPARVLGGEEVPRRSQDVGSHDRSGMQRALDVRVREASGSHADGPLGAGVVLRLNGAESSNDGDGISRGGGDEVLICETQPGDVELGRHIWLVDRLEGLTEEGAEDCDSETTEGAEDCTSETAEDAEERRGQPRASHY